MNIVFDFDGTLVDSAPAIIAAFDSAMKEAGLTPAVPLDASLIGPPLSETLMRLSGSADASLIDTLTENFKRHYDSIGLKATPHYPDMGKLLEQLAAAGTPMHICTNKRLSATQTILSHLGWSGYFSSIYALDMEQPRISGKTQLLSKQIREQGLAPSETFYVGDKREDGLAADANRLAFHYASWGYGDETATTLPPTWRWLTQPADILHSLTERHDAH